MNDLDLFGNPTNPIATSHAPSNDEVSYHIAPPNLEDAPLEDEREPKRHYPFFFVFVGIGITLLIFQCFRLQVTLASQHQSLAQGNSIRIITEQAERGLITDRNGKVLVHNSRQLALAVNPRELSPKRAEREKLYQLLRQRIDLSESEVAFIETNRRKQPDPFAIRTNLSKDDSLLYQEWFSDTPGLTFIHLPTRQYEEIPSLGHLLGYVGGASKEEVEKGASLHQRIGKSGLEKMYNLELTGTPRKATAEFDAQGRFNHYLPGLEDTPAKTGQTLQLGLDASLQQVVADALKHELERREKKYGPLPKLGASAIVLDPRTGAVRAMVSLPDYSGNLFSGGISSTDYGQLTSNPGNPLINRAIQGVFMPGSTLKPLVAAGGLQEGVITADTSMNTPEAITIGNFRFPDWKLHGQTNTRKAIAESNNIFFYAVGGGWEERNMKGLGVDRLNYYLSQFGLGKPTGVDLPSETSGLLPDDTWKRKQHNEQWYIGDTYHSSIGQGYLLATPLQMANATATIANGGTLWQPHLAEAFIDPETQAEKKIEPVAAAKSFIEERHLKTVREGMRQAVETGSARLLNQLKTPSAGKTGTAQFGSQGYTHAWFTGFAPYDNPEIAYAVVIEGGGESFYSSVPAVEEILRGYFNEPLAEGQKLISAPDEAGISAIAHEFRGEE